MSFTLPDLPYPYDALQPYMSRETLEYHHDTHHAAYVNTGNNLLKGSAEALQRDLADGPDERSRPSTVITRGYSVGRSR